jgi:hypothetical protein
MARITMDQAILRLKERFKGYETAEVRVGFLSGATYPDGTLLADVAFWNDQGTERGIPSRPFISEAKLIYGDAWQDGLTRNIASGVSPEIALARLGEAVKGDIKHHIVQRVWPQNAESTIERKGFDKPLIDTGTMLNSIEYEVEINGTITANKYGAANKGARGREANRRRYGNREGGNES